MTSLIVDIFDLAIEADRNKAFLDGFIELMWDPDRQKWIEIKVKENKDNDR